LHGRKHILEITDVPKEEHKLNLDEITKEFEEHKEELLLQGEDTSSAGSDSEPSEDNMSDDEISKILPVKPKKAKKLVTQASFK